VEEINDIEQVLLAELKGGAWWVRYGAASNPDATENVLMTAITDPEPLVRWATASNPQATEQVLELLAQDPVKWVSIAASRAAAQRR
jgi:HEAT repeat protein